MNSVATKQLPKKLLVKILQQKLNWSENHLNSFTEDSLNHLYEYVLEGCLITKAKTRSDIYYEITMTVPKIAFDYLGIQKGEWFDIRVNIHKKEIILDRNRENRIKLKRQNRLHLPYKLAEKNLLKPNDDIAVIVKDGKIILKSFSYFQ